MRLTNRRVTQPKAIEHGVRRARFSVRGDERQSLGTVNVDEFPDDFPVPTVPIIVPRPGSRTGSGARRKRQAVAQLLCARMFRWVGRDPR